jgi:hypothetical protein
MSENTTFDSSDFRSTLPLATVAFDQGEPEIAKQYATRCHTAILRSDDEALKLGLLDLLG